MRATTSSALPWLTSTLMFWLAAALPARADDPAPPRFTGEAGLGLRYLGGEHDLWIKDDRGASWGVAPSIETMAVEGWAAFVHRPSAAARYRAQVRYAHSADQVESSAFTSGGAGPTYFEGTSTSRGTLQQAEVRLDASFQVPGEVELGPWASFRVSRVDLTLSDTSQTVWVSGFPSTSFVAGPSYTYRDTTQAAWVGVAASWRVLPTLELGAEAALSPWARDRYSLDNLTRSALTTGDATGSGWRAGAEVGWSAGKGHRLSLTSSFERLSTSGAMTGNVYSGPSQGDSTTGQGELNQDTWGVALGWGYAF